MQQLLVATLATYVRCNGYSALQYIFDTPPPPAACACEDTASAHVK